jgi:hypothetical protein
MQDAAGAPNLLMQDANACSSGCGEHPAGQELTERLAVDLPVEPESSRSRVRAASSTMGRRAGTTTHSDRFPEDWVR